jgi:hypothetical protein
LDKSTFTTGVNGIITGEANESDAIVKAVQAADRANQTGELAISNAVGQVGKTLDGISNDISGLALNQTNASTDLSNRLSGASGVMAAATNQAGGINFSGLASGASAFDVSAASSGGAISGWTIGGAHTITITPAVASAVAPVGVVHDIIAWMAYATLFLACYRRFMVALRSLLVAPQTRTAGTEFAGSSVNFASAMVVASLIVATVVAFSSHFVADLGTMLSAVSGNPFASLSSVVGWGYAETCCPFDVILSTIGSYFAFMISVDWTSSVASGIIRFYVGL